VRVKVWERGAGPTLACGTGACAVVVAGRLTRRTHRRCRVTLPGGDLDIYCCVDDAVAASSSNNLCGEMMMMVPMEEDPPSGVATAGAASSSASASATSASDSFKLPALATPLDSLGCVLMGGPAQWLFKGEFDLDQLLPRK
jgi:hypothetical protein